MFEYKKISNDICVTVKPEFCEDKSHIVAQKYVFIYHVTIENNSNRTLQLLRRSWLIKDSMGDIYEVNGEGVVGKQPILEAGALFSYQSYCVLKSPSGSMEGFYEMITHSEDLIKIAIPRFYLRSHLLN